MTSVPLGNNINLPATPPTYYIGVNSHGTPAMGQTLNSDVFGAPVPGNVQTFEFTFDTTSCPVAETCTLICLWSLDGGTTYVPLPGAGGASFTGGQWVNKLGQQTGVKQIGPDAVQQSPHPDHFIIQVTDCPSGMGPLKSVFLIIN